MERLAAHCEYCVDCIQALAQLHVHDPLLEATAELVRDIQLRMSALGAYDGPASGSFDEPTRTALSDWAGEYNLEGRLRTDDQISQLLIRELRDVTPEIQAPS